MNLIAFSDSHWALSVKNGRSITGYCFSLTKQGPTMSRKSKKQPTVALSTCDAILQKSSIIARFLLGFFVCLFVFVKLDHQMHDRVLAVTLQCIALWESWGGSLVGCIMGISSESGYIWEFFGVLQILLVFTLGLSRYQNFSSRYQYL